jgi:ATP-dependent protease ClpP protease subunit
LSKTRAGSAPSTSTRAYSGTGSSAHGRIIAQHTGQPLERVSKDRERDYFMTSEEAREYGIIDRVIAHR